MKEVSLWLEDGLDLESMDLFMQNPGFNVFTTLQIPQKEEKEEDIHKGKEEDIHKGKEEDKGSGCASM